MSISEHSMLKLTDAHGDYLSHHHDTWQKPLRNVKKLADKTDNGTVL